MHRYREEDFISCLKGRKITYIGDSSIRQLFWATAKKLGLQEQGEEKWHADHFLSIHDVSIEFIWDPWLNSSSAHRELLAASIAVDDADVTDTAAILLIGGGLWHARYLEEVYLPHYEESLQQIAHTALSSNDEYEGKGQSESMSGKLHADSLVVLSPVPVLDYKSLSQIRAQTITAGKVETMNARLQNVSMARQTPVAWNFNSMTVSPETVYQSDGLHVMSAVASNMADVLLNARCNAALRKSQTRPYPMDKTCCNSYEPPNWTQYLILNGSMAVLPLLALFTPRDVRRTTFMPSREVTRAAMVLGLALCHCYYADRTHLFNKVHKLHSSTEFMVLCAASLMPGILSTRRSNAVMQSRPESQHTLKQDQDFLSRHQTDEWKGWMQIIILIYHYTGASKILWIYRIIRLLVAAYLFMTGFGHTIFFYKKANYSLRRSAAVLIRLNMLSCLLPYVMGTEYLFYYFAPLVSFWYIVIYVTMAIGHRKNDSFIFIIAKVLISAALTTMLTMSPEPMQILFQALRKSCNIHWDVKEWRFRLQLDGYIVYVGMLAALLFIRITEVLRSSESPRSFFDEVIRRHFHRIRLAGIICATPILMAFFVYASKTSSKEEYNHWVPYVSAIPILSFVALRNLNRHSRNYHSPIFAWIGRHSLETFTLQFHIWLAADTKGLLSTGLFEWATGDIQQSRRLDLAILTIIFLWVCSHVAEATQTLTSWLISPQERPQERREDVGIDEDFRDKDIFLLSLTDHRGKSQNAIGGLLGIKTMISKIAAKAKKTLVTHLELRLVILFGIMWVLNIANA